MLSKLSKMEILENINNSLLNRQEIKVLVESPITPSFIDAEKIISDKFSKSTETIAIKNVKGKFGRNTFLIHSFIYDSKENKDKIEPKKKEKKK